MSLIASRSNPKIKLIRSLRQRKARQESRLFLAEGIRLVGEAAEANAPIEYLCYCPQYLNSDFALSIVQKLSKRGAPCLAVSAEVFDSLADKENPQGILAVVRQVEPSLADFSPQNFSWGVALAAPQDPGNIGTILRTIDAVDASGLLLLEGGADPYHPSAVRASMGAIFWRPFASAAFADFERWARQHQYHIYGTSAHASLDYRQVERYHKPAVLLLGSEREGLSESQKEACDTLIRLPMQGRVTSLNLAVAAGILLYHMAASF